MSPSAGLVVADTDGLSSTDGEPPNGVPLHYTVFGTRGADIWSAGTSALVIVLLPEVTACQLEVQDDAILGSWRVAAGTADVSVTRAEGSPPPGTGGEQIATSLAGFHDTGLRAGTRYYYRIRAIYVSDTGERRITPGIVCWATPETALEMAREFRAEAAPGRRAGGDAVVAGSRSRHGPYLSR